MILKELRVKMHPELMRRYKILCLQNRLNLAKQTNELVRNFVDIHEKNYEITKNLERK